MGKFFEVTPLRKIGIGLFLTAIAAVVPSLIQERIDAGEMPHMNWQVLAYLLLTAAEVLVSITALEFSYTQAPKKMKSFIMGLYLLSVTLGNMFVAEVNGYIGEMQKKDEDFLDGASYYWFFTICMAVTAIVFLVWSQFYKGHTFIQGTDAPLENSRGEETPA
jgi:POT family proton-dependent oligopeptide transporter